ncbi:phage baseplate assembly protein [Sphingobium yanoikuyae]|uniref:phage baseplate assembly protein n=1 Tax=Sphingobium yanoikuyae TaxID=13690 RepID=UPI0026EA456A|nr:contractile injection system protein, VgrG/Pvc8 family [Sphingobium yanoikuyae]
MADADIIAEKVELAINGKLYAGWTEVSVTRAIDAMCGAFRLSLSSKDDAAGQLLVIAPDDRCQLKIGGEIVIDGWVDAVSPAIDGESHGITVEGRDKTGDLADCSAIHKPGSWRNVTLEVIASALTKPFGVTVTAKASTGAAIRKFAIQQGETVADAIGRLLRFRGLIAVPTASGDLEITTPDAGAPVATLELGINIKSAEGRADHRERYSDYVVKGQAHGDDERHGKTVSQIKGEAKDSGVRRYRPLLLVAEEQSDGASAGARAKFEAGVRAGRARGAQIKVLGWRVAPGGALWRPNSRVRVRCAEIAMADEVMLVAAVTFSKSDGEGTIATLSIAPPGAFAQLAEKEPK